MNKGHITKRPSPMFKDEFIYQATIKRPDGSEVNTSDWTSCFEDALQFLMDRGIMRSNVGTMMDS